jgi:hypothetical protein
MNKLLIGKDCSPSRMMSHHEVYVTKVLVSYGGGMGGTNKTYYCQTIVRDKDFYKLTLRSGEVIEVNPTFIVEMTPVTLVVVIVDVTGHSYFNTKKARKCIRTMITELKFEQEYEVVEETHEKNDQRIIDDITFI